MNKCIIFLSKYEEYLGSAKKIQSNINMKTDIYYIEEFLKIEEAYKKLDNSIIYFLCNSNLIKRVLELSSSINCYIFNKKFFEKNYNKLEIQKILAKNNFSVPKIFNKYQDIEYPVFCKENKHAGIIFKAYTKKALLDFFENIDVKNFYIEENIEGQKEEKYYFVKEKIFCKNTLKISNVIVNCCNTISKILNLEIFSVDIVKKDNSYIILDVNSSAGFYLLDEARNSLINEIEKLK